MSSAAMAAATSAAAQPPDSPNGNVYLFTFLITLFLLLFVSTAIAFRTYIIRRQFRREEPLGDPVIPPFPRGTGESIVPVTYDVYFTPGNSTWHDMQPVSVQLLKNPPPDTRQTENNINSTSTIDTLTLQAPQPALTRFGTPLSSRATAPHGQLLAQPSLVEVNEGAAVQVVVVVAMPTVHQDHRSTSYDENKQDNLHMPSEIALGVTKLTVATGSDTDANSANI